MLNEEFLSELSELGETEAEIARSLARSGCGGTRGNAEDCVLTRWLQKQFPGLVVAVDPYDCTLTYRTRGSPRVVMSLPEAHAALAVSFDLGDHPELES